MTENDYEQTHTHPNLHTDKKKKKSIRMLTPWRFSLVDSYSLIHFWPSQCRIRILFLTLNIIYLYKIWFIVSALLICVWVKVSRNVARSAYTSVPNAYNAFWFKSNFIAYTITCRYWLVGRLVGWWTFSSDNVTGTLPFFSVCFD